MNSSETDEDCMMSINLCPKMVCTNLCSLSRSVATQSCTKPEACPVDQRSSRLPSQKDCVSAFCLYSVLGVKACQELSDCHRPMGPRNTSSPGIQSQVAKGCLLGDSHQNQGPRCSSKLPSRRRVLCSTAEVKHENGTHWL